MTPLCWVRRPISSKPCTCTERNGVDPAGISVKVGAQYPGRSSALPERATGIERCGDGAGEVSRGHSRCAAHRRAEHERTRVGPVISMDDEEAQARTRNTNPDVADAGYGGRNPTGVSDGAEAFTATGGKLERKWPRSSWSRWSSAATCGGRTTDCCATRAPRVPMA